MRGDLTPVLLTANSQLLMRPNLMTRTTWLSRSDKKISKLFLMNQQQIATIDQPPQKMPQLPQRRNVRSKAI
jgi:hypothetical protein